MPQIRKSCARGTPDRRTRGARSRHATLPSTIAVERATTPFLRVSEAALVASASRYADATLTNPVEVFAALGNGRRVLRKDEGERMK